MSNSGFLCKRCGERIFAGTFSAGRDFYCFACLALLLKTEPALASDDAEPITRAFVEELGGPVAGWPCVRINDAMTVAMFPTGEIVLVVSNGEGNQPHDEPLYHIRTRGQLRALLAALGWRKEG